MSSSSRTPPTVSRVPRLSSDAYDLSDYPGHRSRSASQGFPTAENPLLNKYTARIEVEQDDRASALKSHNPSRWDRFSDSVHRLWIYEVAASLLSLASVAAVAAILAKYDGRALPDWPLSISINSLISIFVTILKVTMLYAVAEALSQAKWLWFMKSRPLSDLAAYDQASRGPMGAVRFIFRGRLDAVALLGALLVIVALAIDPFAQQVIAYKACSLPDHQEDGSATMKRITSFGDAQSDQVAPVMARSILAALVNLKSDIYPAIEPQCHTGNCTFSGEEGYYQSLVIAHGCQDATDSVVKVPQSNTTSFFNYTLPQPRARRGLQINFPSPNSETEAIPQVFNVGWTYGSDNFNDLGEMSLLFFNGSRPIDPAYLQTNQGRTNLTDRLLHVDYSLQAARCQFKPFMRTVNTNVTSSRATTTEVSREQLFYQRNGPGVWHYPTNISIDQAFTTFQGHWEQGIALYNFPSRILLDGVFQDCTNTTSPDDIHTMALGNATDRSSLRFHIPQCVNRISSDAMQQFAVAIGQLYPTSASAEDQSDPNIIQSPFEIGKWVQVDTVANKHLTSLWGNGNATFAQVDLYATRIAEALTAAMTFNANTTDGTSLINSVGQTQIGKTCAYAKWEWLSLPAALAVLTNVFLLITIVKSRAAAGRPGWPGLIKSSPLGLLFYRPTEDPARWHRGAANPESMFRAAEKVKAALERRFDVH